MPGRKTAMTRPERTDRYGFRFRGGENTRIEAFTDAAFAFAVTLLVIGGGHVPNNVDELMQAMSGLPGYAASFALLCVFWYAHYIWYKRYGVEDGRSVMLSLLLVFLVLIYVYPLHTMFDAAISLGDRATAVRSPRDWKKTYELFGIAYASMSAVIMLFYFHALRLRRRLALDDVETAVTRTGVLRWFLQSGVGVLSAVLAMLILDDTPGVREVVPGLVYWLIPAFSVLLRGHLRRQLVAIGAAS
jgi:uncharacterized membrane protein